MTGSRSQTTKLQKKRRSKVDDKEIKEAKKRHQIKLKIIKENLKISRERWFQSGLRLKFMRAPAVEVMKQPRPFLIPRKPSARCGPTIKKKIGGSDRHILRVPVG